MLGEHVRNIRKKRGITLKELAEKTGLSIGYISQIERGFPPPPLPPLSQTQRRSGHPHLSVYGR